MKYTVNTQITSDGDIMQEVNSEFNRIVQNLTRELYRAKEKEFIDALIKLGWTPPANERRDKNAEKI